MPTPISEEEFLNAARSPDNTFDVKLQYSFALSPRHYTVLHTPAGGLMVCEEVNLEFDVAWLFESDEEFYSYYADRLTYGADWRDERVAAFKCTAQEWPDVSRRLAADLFQRAAIDCDIDKIERAHVAALDSWLRTRTWKARMKAEWPGIAAVFSWAAARKVNGVVATHETHFDWIPVVTTPNGRNLNVIDWLDALVLRGRKDWGKIEDVFDAATKFATFKGIRRVSE